MNASTASCARCLMSTLLWIQVTATMASDQTTPPDWLWRHPQNSSMADPFWSIGGLILEDNTTDPHQQRILLLENGTNMAGLNLRARLVVLDGNGQHLHEHQLTPGVYRTIAPGSTLQSPVLLTAHHIIALDDLHQSFQATWTAPRDQPSRVFVVGNQVLVESGPHIMARALDDGRILWQESQAEGLPLRITAIDAVHGWIGIGVRRYRENGRSDLQSWTCHRTDTGTKGWTIPATQRSALARPILADNRLWMIHRESWSVLAADPASGAELARYRLPLLPCDEQQHAGFPTALRADSGIISNSDMVIAHDWHGNRFLISHHNEPPSAHMSTLSTSDSGSRSGLLMVNRPTEIRRQPDAMRTALMYQETIIGPFSVHRYDGSQIRISAPHAYDGNPTPDTPVMGNHWIVSQVPGGLGAWRLTPGSHPRR